MVKSTHFRLVEIFAICVFGQAIMQPLAAGPSPFAAPAGYSHATNELWLELAGVTNNVASFIIHTPQTNWTYDVLGTTNLNTAGASQANWVPLMRTLVGQTNFVLPIIWPREAWFRVVVTPPQALPEAYLGSVNSWLIVSATNGVLVNDTDPNADPLTAVLVTNVSHGTLNLSPNGSFSYLPNNNVQDADYFHYRASNGKTLSAAVSVKIGLQPNRRPIAGPNSRWFSGEHFIHLAAPGVLVGASDPDGDPVFARPLTNQFLSFGSLSIGTNGVLDYAGEPCFYVNDFYNDYVVYSVDAYGHVQYSTPTALYLDVAWPARPLVTWLAPTNGATATTSNVLLRASVTEAGGCNAFVNSVDFYDGGNLIGSAPGATVPTNFTFIWTNAPIGTHSISAIASVGGASGTSSVVNINIAPAP